MLGLDPRAARATWTVIVVALLCLVIYSIRQALFSFVIALLFAYLLLPLVDFIDRVLPLTRSRGPALAIVYTLLVAVLIIVGTEIGSRVTEQAKNLAQKVTEYLKPEQVQKLTMPQPLQPIDDRVLNDVCIEVN